MNLKQIFIKNPSNIIKTSTKSTFHLQNYLINILQNNNFSSPPFQVSSLTSMPYKTKDLRNKRAF